MRSLRDEVSVPEAIVRVLEEAGIDMVFGMPGGNTVHIYNALFDHQSTIRTVLVREESLSGVMAEVYGRLTGRPGVTMGQGAFTLSNSMLGALEAHLGSSPMLLLAELTDGAPFSQHGPYQSGTGEYGSWDAKASFAGATKLTMAPHGPAQAIHSTQLAIKHALTGERGPVAVLYHSDALSGRVGPDTVPRIYPTSCYLPSAQSVPCAQRVAAVARVLEEARNPVIIAGNGVRISRSFEQLQQVAETLRAPVATTASGKGVFPETHDLALGVMGNFGLELANSVIGDSDVILAVGTKLGPTDTVNEHPAIIDPERQRLIQIDVEPKNASWAFPVEHVLTGDAGEVLSLLDTELRASQRVSKDRLAERGRYVQEARQKHGFFDGPESVSNQTPILPQRIIKELHNAIADDAIVTCDAGENRIFMTHYFQTKQADTFLQPASVGGMGYAIPAALAAKLVYPNRQVVAVCGDGGFGMAMNGLITAYEERIPIVNVVFNNQSLGWVKHGQGDRVIASDFAAIDHAAIARAIGCRGIRVESVEELPSALRDALASNEPTVVDVISSQQETFRKVSSPLLGATAEEV